MRTRLGVIGDSHAASLKRAWDRMPELHSSFELRFFCARGLELSAMAVDELRLVPKSESLERMLKFTAGGAGVLDPRDFDIYLIYGLGCYPYFSETDVFHSRATLAAALRASADATLSFELLRRLRTITAKDIYVGHRPLDAAKGDITADVGDLYPSSIRRMNEVLYRPLRATLVPQPAETIVGGRFTLPGFSRGSRRLAVGDELDDELHPDHDDVHMNDDFGSRWLARFLREELTASPSVAAPSLEGFKEDSKARGGTR